jgi:hypothetical protein
LGFDICCYSVLGIYYYTLLIQKEMIWDYDTSTVDQELLFDHLIEKGKECWELTSVIPAQKLIQSKILGQPPQVISAFMLIFKRPHEQSMLRKT